MSLELCVLASGSSGNCAALRTPAGVVLIDAGIGPRTTAARMNGTGIGLADVRAIVLTHLDRDHFSPRWFGTILARGMRLFCGLRPAEALCHRAADWASENDRPIDEVLRALRALIVPFDDARSEGVQVLREGGDELHAAALPLAHDLDGSHGFLFDGFGCRVGYATDLGHVPQALIERFERLNLLAIESNYDPAMQESSARPRFLKRRIMGGRGHLSNGQALRAVGEIFSRHERAGLSLPAHVVLLHRSRECNCPKLLRRVFAEDPRIAARLTLAEQYQRTEWLRVTPARPTAGEQLVLAWG